MPLLSRDIKRDETERELVLSRRETNLSAKLRHEMRPGESISGEVKVAKFNMLMRERESLTLVLYFDGFLLQLSLELPLAQPLSLLAQANLATCSFGQVRLSVNSTRVATCLKEQALRHAQMSKLVSPQAAESLCLSLPLCRLV